LSWFESGPNTVVGVGATDCVATLGERKSGFTMLGKLCNRSSRGMGRRGRMLVRRAPPHCTTLTADIGTEFHDYGAIDIATGGTVYFATPPAGRLARKPRLRAA